MNLISAGRVDEASNVEFHLLFWQTNVGPKEVVHVLNRSRAFVVITGGNAADHSIVVGIVGERVLLSLLSYCYLFVIVMPVSVPCCRCYHVWNTLLPKDTFLSAIVENLKKRQPFQQKTPWQLFNSHWMPHEWKGISMFHGADVSCVREEYFWCFTFSRAKGWSLATKRTRYSMIKAFEK